ncbi:hypothetical protein E2P81_ATG08092 [Venturia nashicola]|nr:hypothetical protein E2P81_ATG08092 [Venturia nashicola]
MDDGRLSGIAKKLCDKSKELVRGSAGEAEWIEAIQVALEELGFSAVKFARNRDWLNELIPPFHNPPPAIPRKRNQQRNTIELLDRDMPNVASVFPPLFNTIQATVFDSLRFSAEKA